MKKILSLLTAVLLLLAVPAAKAEKNNYELRLGEFNILHVSDNVNVVWTASKDSAGYVRFYGDDCFADAFIMSNNGKGTLKVQVAVEDANHPDLPTLYVYSSFLTEVKSSSALTVTVNPMPAAAHLRFTLIGNGRVEVKGIDCTHCDARLATGNGFITLAGRCQDARFNMTGTGQIRADELRAENVNCTFTGTGAIFTWPVKELKAKGIGSTSIYYRGNPEEVSKRGGGKLVKMENTGATLPETNAGTSDTRHQLPATQWQEPVNQSEEVAEEEVTVEEEIEEEEPESGEEETVEEEEEEEITEEEEEPLNVPERRN